MFFKIFNKTGFEWLDTSIGKMLEWAEKVKIENDQLPRFNDSSIDMINSPDEIINFGYSYLNNKIYKGIKLNPLKIF